MPQAQMGPHAAVIYKFVYYINLIFFLVFVLAFEIIMLNAIKKRTHFVSLAPLLPSRTRVRFFTLVLNKWWAKLVIQVLVEYQVPNFEMAISFKLRLEYVKGACSP